jgi:VWFA-related protein
MRGLRKLILPVLAIMALAQQTGVVFRATTNLVILDVFVRDRSGKEITGLTKEDFTVLEDGKPQVISVFEFQQLDAPQEAPEIRPPAPAAPAPATPARPQVINIAAPGKIQYRDRRLLVLLFDYSSMPAADQIRAQNSALKFLEQQMRPADMVAIMSFATQLKVEQDFTADRDQLTRVIKSFRIGEASELAAEASTDDENAEDTGAAYTADESEFNIFNTDRKLSALESAAKMLAGLPEKKALVYFSSGIGRTGAENDSQLRSTVNAAVRANVSFYPVDARGLMATIPGGDASQGATRGTSLFSGQAQRRQMARLQNQQETLFSLAEDTGGKAFLDSNDLSLGIRQAQEDIRSYYILGYYTSNPAQDGRFRRIQVRMNRQLQAKLDYRSGYFAPKEFGKFTDADKEMQLQEALALGDPITDLPLALEVNYFRVARERYFVPVAVKIPGSEIALARKGSNESTELDFIGQLRDAKGRLAGTVRDGIRVRLSAADVAQLKRRNFQYDTGFTLVPGQYRLKFLARENQTGRIGTFEMSFQVPDLNAVADRLRISSVVLSNQREPISAAVGSALGNRRLLESNPLVENNQKLIPSVTRVFRKDQNLYVYLEVYDAAADAADRSHSVLTALSFYRGRTKVFESNSIRVTESLPKRPGVMPVQFQVPLEKLTAGPYICQISLVDEVGKKFAFPRATVVLLP